MMLYSLGKEKDPIQEFAIIAQIQGRKRLVNVGG
jgi:hypothetical protein